MYALIALYCVAMYSVGLPHVRCMFILIVLSCAVFVVAMYSAGCHLYIVHVFSVGLPG